MLFVPITLDIEEKEGCSGLFVFSFASDVAETCRLEPNILFVFSLNTRHTQN